ncbi:hypothetical protein AK34_337 [Burkholderia dolosa AU0158]|nr:hypothetical protein AK34_337 [Burkholderia dolosa AU0158]VWB19782.1 hypothetical protein BDO18943_00749 [Burkholderia dolosa]
MDFESGLLLGLAANAQQVREAARRRFERRAVPRPAELLRRRERAAASRPSGTRDTHADARTRRTGSATRDPARGGNSHPGRAADARPVRRACDSSRCAVARAIAESACVPGARVAQHDVPASAYKRDRDAASAHLDRRGAHERTGRAGVGTTAAAAPRCATRAAAAGSKRRAPRCTRISTTCAAISSAAAIYRKLVGRLRSDARVPAGSGRCRIAAPPQCVSCD